MLKETDLRIGNIVYYLSEEAGHVPYKVDWHDIQMLSEDQDFFNEKYKAIPISLVVLESLGWSIDDGGDHHYLKKEVGEWGLFSIYSDSSGLSFVHHNSSISKRIKYYHELQNIFYFTTGFELSDKLEELEESKLVFKILSDGSHNDPLPF
jgi:hypothetical protein